MKRLLKGGRVVDPANGIDGVARRADRRRSHRARRPRSSGRRRDGRRDSGGPRGLSRASSTCTCTCASRARSTRRRSPPARRRRWPAASPPSPACRTRRRSTTTPTSPRYILAKAAEANLARVYPIGAVSRGSKGELLADIAELKQAGCVAITDDGHPVATALLLRRALEYAGMFGMPVIEHCEDPSLKGDGVAHEGFHAVVARPARHSRRRARRSASSAASCWRS